MSGGSAAAIGSNQQVAPLESVNASTKSMPPQNATAQPTHKQKLAKSTRDDPSPDPNASPKFNPAPLFWGDIRLAGRALTFLSFADLTRACGSCQMLRSCLKPTHHLGWLKRSMTSANYVENAKAALRSADAVCFDVDSTVCVNEGLDDLAAFCGKGEAIAELTRKAMGGSVPFEVALGQRLDLLQPTRQQLDSFLLAEPPILTAGVSEFISALHSRGTVVHLISGGFTDIIYPCADLIGVPHDNVEANVLLFHGDGSYRGFDDTAFTSRSGGKAKAVASIVSGLQAAGTAKPTVVMIGDGATDLEAKPPADVVIGFGGIVEREVVREKADWFVKDFSELTALVV